MKALFGVLSLAIVLAVVGLSVGRQSGAVSTASRAAMRPNAGTESAPSPGDGASAAPLQALPERVRGDVDRAFQNAASARERAIEP